MNKLQGQIDFVRKRHSFLLPQSQNPHTDPHLESIELAIFSLETKSWKATLYKY